MVDLKEISRNSLDRIRMFQYQQR